MGDFTSLAGTLLGPLTTAWSMPASCSVHVLNCANCTAGYRGQRCVVDNSGIGGQPADYTGCWPPATARAGTPQAPFAGWGFYSPGLACPTGYTAACTAQHGGRAEWDIEFILVPGETAIGCCPQGFRCTNLFGNTCIATATASTGTSTITAATGVCSGSELVSVSQLTLPNVIVIDTPSATTNAADNNMASLLPPAAPVQTVTRPVTLFAPMFQLNYRSSDLAALSPSTSMRTSSTSALSNTSSSSDAAAADSSSAPASASSASSQPGGLSTAAAVGAGVGAALGGILLAAAVVTWWVWVKRRRQRLAAKTVGMVEPAGVDGGAGDWKTDTRYCEYHEAHGWPRSELEADRGLAPVELPTGNPRNLKGGYIHSA